MSLTTDTHTIMAFQKTIMNWWQHNARDLPWRRDPTPYHVLVSEMMLQQTQVPRVIPKYHEFLQSFPTLTQLARADTKQLLRVWNGLGYNRRAIWLRDAARTIIDAGEFPTTVGDLLTLKGVGPYTARSILIFAFNSDLAAVDTNIRRVLLSWGFITKTTGPSEVQHVAEALLLRGRSREWHNALMDYGALVLRPATKYTPKQTRQNGFVGSTRQVRGAVVRLLLSVNKLSLSKIAEELQCRGIIYERLELVLDGLISDGLIVRTDANEYMIARD